MLIITSIIHSLYYSLMRVNVPSLTDSTNFFIDHVSRFLSISIVILLSSCLILITFNLAFDSFTLNLLPEVTAIS